MERIFPSGLNLLFSVFKSTNCESVKIQSYVEGTGLEEPNEAKDNHKLMTDAYNMGKNI